MHSRPDVEETDRKKPFISLFYNKNKVGVDQMPRLYSTHRASRRWPMGVWSNMLDIAVINARVLFMHIFNRKMSRRSFLLELIEQLRSSYVSHGREQPRRNQSTSTPISSSSDSKTSKMSWINVPKCNSLHVSYLP